MQWNVVVVCWPMVGELALLGGLKVHKHEMFCISKIHKVVKQNGFFPQREFRSLHVEKGVSM
jgi:hypothetical protein